MPFKTLVEKRQDVVPTILLAVLAFAPAPVLGGYVIEEVALEKVALVIGNSDYTHVAPLRNPVNDAADVGEALVRLGFKVIRLENAGYTAMVRSLVEFGRTATRAHVAVVFYAGHATGADGDNLLIPVDARIEGGSDSVVEVVPLDLILYALRYAKVHGLAIVDAHHFAPVEPASNTLVAFGTRAVSMDGMGDSRNSPYTMALLHYLEEPGLELGVMFRKVREMVMTSTEGRQVPITYGSLPAEGVYFRQPRTADARHQPVANERVHSAGVPSGEKRGHLQR